MPGINGDLALESRYHVGDVAVCLACWALAINPLDPRTTHRASFVVATIMMDT